MSDGFDDDMMFESNQGQVSDAADFYSSNRVEKEGYYHFECVKVEAGNSQQDGSGIRQVNMTLQCVAGEHPDQVEKFTYYRINLESWVDYDDKSKGKKQLDERQEKNIRGIMYAFGVLSAEDVQKDSVRFSFAALQDRSCIAKVSFVQGDSYKDKETGQLKKMADTYKIQWANHFYRLDDEKVKDVPKDGQIMAFSMNAGNEADDLLSGLD